MVWPLSEDIGGKEHPVVHQHTLLQLPVIPVISHLTPIKQHQSQITAYRPQSSPITHTLIYIYI